MNYARPELRDRLAAEYVLGTLHGGARRRMQALLKADPALQDAVHAWERRLVPIAAALDGPAPAPRVWQGIEARLAQPRAAVAARPASAAGAASSGRPGATATGGAAGPASGAAGPSAGEGFFSRWFGLRPLGMLATGLALGVLGMVVVPQLAGLDRGDVPEGRVLPESYAGFLAPAPGEPPALLVASRRRGEVVDLKFLRPVAPPPGQALVLWALVPGQAPLRLGVVPAGAPKSQLTMAGSSEQLLAKATELAVSAEPQAQAGQAAAPTQPYLLRGPCAKFW